MKGILLIMVSCLILFTPGYSPGRNTYQVVSFGKEEHFGGNQSWGISINEKGEVFIANNEGLIVMNGATIRLLRLPSETIIRSVKCIDNKVFTGSFEEFGYWEQDENSQWTYRSLTHLLRYIKLNNDEFWKIVPHRGKVYFQSFGNIFVYDGNTIESIELPGPILFLYQAKDRLFTQIIEGTLVEIIDNQLITIPGSEIFSSTEVKSILPDGDDLIIGTSTLGLFRYRNQQFVAMDTEANEALKTFQLNNGIVVADKFAFGTLLKGIFIIGKNGRIVHHFHSGNALQNNTILALESDTEGNLWIGMDKGIDYLWFDSPVEIYSDPDISPGSVYSASIFENRLYVGTNQGVYFYDFRPGSDFSERTFVNNSQGQVWFLKVIDNQLYCGTNNGTFVINGDEMIRISDINGGYNFRPVMVNGKQRYVQSTYNDMVLFEKVNNIWQKTGVVEGFISPLRFLETDHLGNLLAGHLISGIYLFQPYSDYRAIENYRKLDSTNGLNFNTNRVFKVDNRILIPDGKKLFQWDATELMVEPYPELNEQLSEFAAAKMIIPFQNDLYWFIGGKTAGMFGIRFGKAELLFRLIPEMYNLDLVDDYENIVALNDSLHLICLEAGFAILNIQNLTRHDVVNKPPIIREISFLNTDGEAVSARSDKADNHVSHRFNNFQVSFSSQEPVGRKKYFQFKLEGIDNEWSEWSGKTEASWLRLPPGKYTFRIRSLNIKGLVTPESSVSFRISRPWFLSNLAIVVDLLLVTILIFLLKIFYKKRKWKKQEQLLKEENEKMRLQTEEALAENTRLTNEKLQAEVSLKNLQLAKNTMAIIRKNEALTEIKEELERQKEELGYRLPGKYYDSMHHLIERNISQDHDWQVFENLFDQAHENFFQRLKSDYPDLTPSDLRLCAYLRINLSSKEIAPLLSITIRGVEEKRYRLRKRLNLAPEQSLTEFIMKY